MIAVIVFSFDRLVNNFSAPTGYLVSPALKRAIEFIKKEDKPAVVDTVTQFR